MIVWRLEATGAGESPRRRPVYDVANGFVVVAISAGSARRMAAESAGDEGRTVWTDEVRSTCEPVGYALGGVEPGVVLRDFTNG